MPDEPKFALILSEDPNDESPFIRFMNTKSAWELADHDLKKKMEFFLDTIPDLTMPVFVHRIGTHVFCTNNMAAMLVARCEDAKLSGGRPIKSRKESFASLSELERAIYREAATEFGDEFLALMHERTEAIVTVKAQRMQYLYIMTREMESRKELRVAAQIIQQAMGSAGPPVISGAKSMMVV